MSWDPLDLPSLSGRIFVVTGANAGLGYFASEQLASTGAHVVLACRSPAKADAAIEALRRRVPGASVSALLQDVADLESVRMAADALLELPRLDGLILNAGIVHPPTDRQVSLDGHELVLATNFLGHFALTARVLPALLATPGSRVVTVGSMISRLMDSSLEDLELESRYDKWKAYAQSKIAMQVLGFELDRRLRESGRGGPDGVQALVVQPGYSISGLTPRIRGVNEPSRLKRLAGGVQVLAAQSKERGAWALVRAAVDPDATGGEYFGPRFLTRGRPVRQTATRTSLDRAIAARLWTRAERLTGVTFPV